MRLHDEFLVRTPMRPVAGAQALLAGGAVDDRALQTAFDDPLVQEAIYLASPSLFNAVRRWRRGELAGSAQQAAKRSLLKYLIRMATRPTPFGLFASCSPGRFDGETRVSLAPESAVRRRAGLEMAVVCTLIETLERDPDVRPHLILTPNDTLVAVGDELRYVEYVYEDARRLRGHRTVAIERNPYLDAMLAAARGGATIATLARAVADDQVSVDDAAAYASELFDNQVLRSNLAPAMTGDHPLTRLIDELPPTAESRTHVARLREAVMACERAGAWPACYENVKAAASVIVADVPDSLVTVDTFRPAGITLAEDIRARITKAIGMLHRWVPRAPNPRLEEFRQLFRERFGDREVPLLRALDPDLGVPYGDRPAPPSPLIDAIDMAPRDAGPPAFAPGASAGKEGPAPQTAAEQWLLARINEAVATGAHEVAITDEDISSLPSVRQDLPATCTATFSIVSVDDRPAIVLTGTGGASAASMLGRFARLDAALLAQVQAIAAHEQQVLGARPRDAGPEGPAPRIVADVLHMPSDRAGNVMWRPAIRRCEIPVLAQPGVPAGQVVPPDDLLLSVPRTGPVRLRSGRLGCDVVPVFGHQHRYDQPEMTSLYRLLGDLQSDGRLAALALPFAAIAKLVPRVPRITCDGCILAPATWRLDAGAVRELRALLAAGRDALAGWQRARRMPDEISVIEHDHELLVNLANADARALLAHELNGKDSAVLMEWLWPDPAIADEGRGFRMEVMAALFTGTPAGD